MKEPMRGSSAETIGLRRERRCGRDVIVIDGLPGHVDAKHQCVNTFAPA